MRGGKLTTPRRKQIHKLLTTVPFASLIGIRLDELEFGHASLFLDVRDELKQNNGVVHGGAIASLIDTATAFAGTTVIRATERLATADLTIKYLGPLTSGRATALATVIKTGQRLITIAVDVQDQNGTPIAAALSTYIRS
jgi:uncharacterized protein (TIGR00369 family)